MKHYILKQGILTIFLWAILHLNLAGQKINTFTIDQPAEIAGDYTIAQAEWGDTSYQSFESIAVLANPANGCDTFKESYLNKVLFIERGNCNFDLKALHAQSAGAMAVIICNNNPLPTDPLFLLPPGDTASHVNIPVFLADKHSCDKLKIYLTGNGLDIRLSHKCAKPVYSDKVVWGHLPGQGDFSNGLDGWTVDKGWTYNREGIIRKGAYTGNPKIVGSVTACTGIAEFNSDHLDTNSIPGTPGMGECPAPCTGRLTSTLITLTKPLKGLGIEFTQSLRQFQSKYYILVSKDKGLTFKDTIQINDNIPFNSSHITERKRALFSGFEGVNEIMIRFEIEGNYYYWAIDDVVVLSVQEADFKIDRKWYSVAPTYKMPTSQVSDIPFMIDFRNEGNLTATNAKTRVTVIGPDTNEEIVKHFNDIEPNFSIKNALFDLPYKSPSKTGRYFAEYSLECLEEEDSEDNRAGFHWTVTEKTFANLDSEEEFGSPYMEFYAAPWLVVPESWEYSIGNIYYVPNGKGYVATKTRFGLENSISELLGQSMRIDLFEWEDEDNSNTSSHDERKRVGSNILVFSEDIQNPRRIELDIWVCDNEGNPIVGSRVKLKDQTTYLMTATVLPGQIMVRPQIKLLGYTPRSLNNYDRSIGNVLSTNYALDSLHKAGIIDKSDSGSLFAWEHPFISIEDVVYRNFRYIFNDAIYTKAYLEMDIEREVGINEPELHHSAINVFPNPAARELFIDFYSDNEVTSALVSIYSLDGKLIYQRDHQIISNNRIKLDISGFSNGMYNLKLETNAGNANRRIVINN